MKHFKLFALALALVLGFSANVYSQWTFCLGSTNITGIGTNPGVYCLDGNNAIVVGGVTGAPKVYRTTNGGVNFVNITGNLTGPELYAGCMIDATTFVVGDGAGNAKIWRTTDAGTTWTTVLTTGGTGGFFNGIVKASLNPNFIIAQSDAPSGTLITYVSTNGGANWTAQNETGATFTVGSLPAVYCIDNQFYGHGSSGVTPVRLNWTSNGGSSWTSTNLAALTGNFLSGLAFHDNKLNGLAASSGSFPTIVRTTNGPAGPWTTVSVGTGTSTLNVMRWVPGTNYCYLGTSVASPNAIRQTTDGGVTWSSMTTAGLTGVTEISCQQSAGQISAYAVCGDGSVLRLLTVVAVDPNNTSVPSSYSLEQNYPNPFNPSTTIKYSVPVAGNVAIKIYNSLGAEVMTVVNKNHTAGNYVESVDLSRFTSGVYFYTLTAGDYKETKKMMLVK